MSFSIYHFARTVSLGHRLKDSLYPSLVILFLLLFILKALFLFSVPYFERVYIYTYVIFRICISKTTSENDPYLTNI